MNRRSDMEKLRIFISGTQEDMKLERDAVDRAVIGTTLSTGIRAETAVSQLQSPRAWIEKQIRECNIYIGVYSHRYGWTIPDENISATEFEFNLARELQKPILVWIRKLRDAEKTQPDFDKQEQFLNRVSDFSAGYFRQVFDDPDNLEKWITAALGEVFTEIIRRGTTPLTSKFLVPFPHNPDFVGRNEDLATLHAMLRTSLSPVGIRPTVLVGLGGIGKTQLAVEYAHAHRADYPGGIFWINAIEPLLFEFARLAEKLELADTDVPRDRAAQRAWEYLDQRTDALVIFDNVLEPADLNIPFTGDLIPANLRCRTLFTTRKRDFPSTFQPFEVKILPEGAAMKLLLRHSSRQEILESSHRDHDLAQVICITLGYLPLALELAAAFLGEYPNIPLYDYRIRLLKEGALDVVDATNLRPEEMPTRHETAVRATLKTSWDALTDNDARLALRAAGQLRQAELIPVPRLGLLTGLEANAKPGHVSPLDRALKKLHVASLVEELTADRLRLHPLVHEFASQLAAPGFRFEMAAQAATALNDLAKLDASVVQRGIDQALEDVLTGLELCAPETEHDTVSDQLSSLARVLEQEMYRLRHWNAADEPAFFLQQFRNRSVELGYNEFISRADAQLAERKLSYLGEQVPVSREPEAVIRVLEGHKSTVVAVAVTLDGRWAISGSIDQTLMVWDLKTGQTIRTLKGHTHAVEGVAVTADGRWAVSASRDQTLMVWDLTTGRAIRTLKGHAAPVRSVAVTADGRWAVSASEDQTLMVWDLTTAQALRTLRGHTDTVEGVAVTADGRLAVSASYDKTLILWDLKTGRAIRTLQGHMGAVQAVAVTADGYRAVSASKDKTLKVWDLTTGRAIITLKGHLLDVRSVALTADGQRAVSAADDGSLKVWDLSTGQAIRTLKAPTYFVNAVAVTPDGRWAISASDKAIRVWDLTTEGFLRTSEGHTDVVNAVAVTPDRQWAVSASHDKMLMVWDLKTGKVVRTLAGHGISVEGVAVTGDGRLAVSASPDKSVQVWDLATGEAGRRFEVYRDPTALYLRSKPKDMSKALAGRLQGVAVTADGRLVLAADANGTVRVWDLTTGRALRTLIGHTGAVNDVVVTADGQQAISAADDDTIRMWDLTTGQTIHTLEGHESHVHAVAVTADGQRVVSASLDETLIVWDLTTEQAVFTLKGHTGSVEDVAVTADGHWAVSASKDKTLKVWDLSNGDAVLTLPGPISFECCAIGPDNRTIVAGDRAGAVHFIRWAKFD